MNFFLKSVTSLGLRPRIIWGLSNSAINFAIIAAIAAMPNGAQAELNLATFYLVFLFWDAYFLAVNDTCKSNDFNVRATTVLSVAMLGSVTYMFIAGKLLDWRLLPIFLTTCWAKALHNSAIAQLSYVGRGKRIALTQALVLIATSLALAVGITTGKAYTFAVLTFAVAPLTALSSGWRPTHQLFRRRDFELLPLIFLDFVKNQIVFVIFGKVVSPAELANILFARSLLSPLALAQTMRRQGIEDDLLIRGVGGPYLSRNTLSIYGILIGSGLVGFTQGTPLAAYVGAWIVVIVLQDLRAHFLRVSLFRRQLGGHVFAGTSAITIGLFVGFSAEMGEFSPWALLTPYLFELAILTLILGMSRAQCR